MADAEQQAGEDARLLARSRSLAALLQDWGLPVTQTNIEQMGVFMEAMEIFVERDALRGGLWREGGPEDSAHHLKSKAMRIMTGLAQYIGTEPQSPSEELDDEGLDAINYAAFAVRNLRIRRRRL